MQSVEHLAEPPIRWRAPLSRAERCTLTAVIAVLLLFALHQVIGAREVRARRAALLARSAGEAASLAPREAAFLPMARGWLAETAAAEYPGDTLAPELRAPGALDALLARSGVYVRAAQPDVVRPGALPDAIRGSLKDAFALCLLRPPASTADADVLTAATRDAPGSAAFDEETRTLARLDTVQRGLRVLDAGWADEVRAAGPIGLRALESELDDRTPAQVLAARGWTRAAYLVAVVDELPEGQRAPEVGSSLAESLRGAMLPAIQEKARAVRVAVFDVAAERLVLRLRRRVDPPALAARTGLADAAPVEDCALAAEVRRGAP